MAEHPAHGLAAMAANAAEELRGYMNPADPFPWELTATDHLDLLPRLYGTMSQLAECVASLAQATTDETAKRWLTEGAKRMRTGCDHVKVAYNLLEDDPGDQPDSAPSARSAQVTADSPDKTVGAGGPRTHSSLDFPNPVAPSTPTRATGPRRATGQVSPPPSRRTL